MTLEELAKNIFDECEADGEPVTEEEALEMARMEIGAKDIKNYAQADKPKKVVKREKKVDVDKAEIIKIIHQALVENGFEDATITNIDKYIDFGNYTINLIKHRPKK